jgi:hypothetical protein
MNTRTFYSTLTLIAILCSLVSCSKKEATDLSPVDETGVTIPSGDRIRIHFGTSTQTGCVYSFTNCIWIGWGTEAINADARLALEFEKGDEAGLYFGQYFPLTADYVVEDAEAQALNIEPQVIPAGFYPLRENASGQATGKRTVSFNPAECQSTGSLMNSNNPQDNIGQLHNLAVQVVLHDNREAISLLKGNNQAIQKLVTEKTIEFLAAADLPLTATEQQRIFALNLNRDFGDYAARLDETRLSANDKKVLLGIFDEAAAMPVGSPTELGVFVHLMTEQENRLAKDATLDNPKMVLSMISVLKYSRYFWYWKAISSPASGAGSTPAAEIPDWVWADIIGLELGGPGAAVLASAIVYLDQH